MTKPPQKDRLFGRLLLHYGLLTKDQLVEALQKQSREGGERRIGEILIADGLLSRKRFEQLLEIQKQYQAKLADRERDETEAPEPEPARESSETGTPAGPEAPGATGGTEESPLQETPVGPLVEDRGPIRATGDPAEGPGSGTKGTAPVARPQPEPTSPPAAAKRAELGEMETLLRQAVEAEASDLHIHVGSPVRMRRFGDLEERDGSEITAADSERLLGEILTPDQHEILDEAGQVDFSYTLPDVARFRVNAYRQQNGLDAVFRVIPPEPPSLTDLGLPLDLARFANYHQGMVLVTGPSGCGKSSTLAALVRILNEERRDHVITIEDPIEHVHRSDRAVVNQRQVGSHTESFSRALRAALREDPDIIAVGELRDLETISLALTAAETGHLVLTTLHTTNAIATINRLIGVFPPDQQPQIRTMVSESLRAVISQRLVKRADGEGRVPALEILVANKAVSNLIREEKTFQIPSIMQTGSEAGMQSLDAALQELVEAGTITGEEARRNAEDPKRFDTAPRPSAGRTGQEA
ncbi:MAG: PilT/PilU family type 4a pilus ATPase [Thermoanaerobaculia bacterium]|nr:PilT/PilU family type 4a pilus ATPase [Thermoanaerobaculia bacterium]